MESPLPAELSQSLTVAKSQVSLQFQQLRRFTVRKMAVKVGLRMIAGTDLDGFDSTSSPLILTATFCHDCCVQKFTSKSDT